MPPGQLPPYAAPVSQEQVPVEGTSAPAPRSVDVGTDVPDLAEALHRRRRATIVESWAFIGFWCAIPFLAASIRDRPPRVMSLVLGVLWLGLLLYRLYQISTPAGRNEWQEEATEEIRVEHALRHHVSIGEADRELVTARAEKIDEWAPLALVGWPVLGGLALTSFVLLADVPLPADVAATLLVVSACVAIVLRRRRRWGWARRWLADPLPPRSPLWT
jgi:hypothetical protein